MSQPESKQNEPSKMKKLLNGGSEESPMARLQRSVGTTPRKDVAPKADLPDHAEMHSAPKQPSKPRTQTGIKLNWGEWKFLPAFWTIASVMSITVNVVLLIIVAILWQNLNTVGVTVTGISDQLLGGLYNNFVKMDAASIETSIHVEKDIPVQFTLNVSGGTNVTLSEDVRINGAVVSLPNFAGQLISNERANIILPAGTVLPIFIENLVVPVDKTVPAVLDVPVNIPLNTTDLHEPFVGLQDVVRPYYCLIKPGAMSIIDNSPVCP